MRLIDADKLEMAEDKFGVINGVVFRGRSGGKTRETVKAALKAMIDRAPTVEINGETSDGYHTFNELYHHRAVLFSVICNLMPDVAWKSKLHETGDMYDGMFIVGIETPEGQATYHYNIEPYWDMFNIKELECAPKWDGHTPAEAIQRIGKINNIAEWDDNCCTGCGNVCLGDMDFYSFESINSDFCPSCGKRMVKKEKNNADYI